MLWRVTVSFFGMRPFFLGHYFMLICVWCRKPESFASVQDSNMTQTICLSEKEFYKS